VKTVLIWDQCGYEELQFAVIDRDVTHLNGVYINHADQDEALCDELNTLFYDTNGRCVVPLSKEFPVDAVKQGAPVIVCGFLP
jgi:hypothetical protein